MRRLRGFFLVAGLAWWIGAVGCGPSSDPVWDGARELQGGAPSGGPSVQGDSPAAECTPFAGRYAGVAADGARLSVEIDQEGCRRVELRAKRETSRELLSVEVSAEPVKAWDSSFRPALPLDLPFARLTFDGAVLVHEQWSEGGEAVNGAADAPPARRVVYDRYRLDGDSLVRQGLELTERLERVGGAE